MKVNACVISPVGLLYSTVLAFHLLTPHLEALQRPSLAAPTLSLIT